MWLLHTSVKLAYTERLNNTGQDMTQPNNQQAFPHEFRDGMTLRDYFAAKAMQAYCSDPDWREDMDSSATSRAAYRMADAMLVAREKS